MNDPSPETGTTKNTAYVTLTLASIQWRVNGKKKKTYKIWLFKQNKQIKKLKSDWSIRELNHKRQTLI